MARNKNNVENLASILSLVQGRDPNTLSKEDMISLRMSVVEECFAGDVNPKHMEVALRAIKELESALSAENVTEMDQKLAAKLPPGTLTLLEKSEK